MEKIILLTVFVSFAVTYLVLPFWIRKARDIGLVWEDMNKFHKKKDVSGAGGVSVVLGTMIGIFLYIAIITFYFESSDGNMIGIFAILSTIFLVTGVGLIDDLLGWKKGGLSIRTRLILVLFSAIPLMVINAGDHVVLGLELGILYPLLVIPIGILGATTTYNFLAGFNGLETSQGIIILSALGITAYLNGNSWLTVVSFCMVASLVAFFIFNMFPAKIFPGDVLTYAVGAMIASMAILGNMEKIALIFFIPYGIETVLKIRGKLKKYSFGKPNIDGTLEMPYEKIYGLEHFAIKILKKVKKNGKVYERDVVFFINLIQLIFIIIGFLTLRIDF